MNEVPLAQPANFPDTCLFALGNCIRVPKEICPEEAG